MNYFHRGFSPAEKTQSFPFFARLAYFQLLDCLFPHFTPLVGWDSKIHLPSDDTSRTI